MKEEPASSHTFIGIGRPRRENLLHLASGSPPAPGAQRRTAHRSAADVRKEATISPPSGMTSIDSSIHSRGGLAATYELYSEGFTRGDLRRAVQHRLIIRVRQGWYALPGVHPDLMQAARVGGRLTCLSGIRLHGAWQYPTRSLHVATAANSCRLREPTDKSKRLSANTPVRVHWRDHEPTANRLMLSPS